MRASLKIFILIACVLYANAQRRYGGRCRDMRCAPSEQCIGFYEPCQKGQSEGTDCGSYPTCVQREGQVILPDRPAPSSSASQGDDSKDREKNTHHVSSPSEGDGNLYPSLPSQPSYPSSGNNYPAAPNSGGYTPPQQPGYGGQGGQSGYPTAPNAGGYTPPQQPAYGGQGGQGGQSGYPGAYPNYPAPNNPSPNYPPPGYPAPSSGNKGSSSDSGGSGFSSFLNFLGGGNRGSGSSGGGGGGGGADFGSILNLLGGAGGSGGGSSGGYRGGSDTSGGPDLRSLLNAFGGSGGSGSLENSALNGLINQFRGSGGNKDSGYGSNNYDRSHNPNGQNPNPYGAAGGAGRPGGAGQYGPGSSDPSQEDGSSFLSSLTNFATSPIGSQLIQRALQANRESGGNGGGDSVQNRRFGGLFSENPGSSSPSSPVSGAGSRGYPTQAPYRPNYPVQPTETQRSYSSNDREPSSDSTTSDKPKPYGWNVKTD